MASAIRAGEKRQAANALIEENSGVSTREEPTYELLSVDFNDKTRGATAFFEESTRYRKIDRYVTQDYVRYPVYSDWKTKTKEIRKTLRLTNENLEGLNCDPDPLIADFAFDILTEIGDESILPSWYNRMIIEEKAKNQLEALKGARNGEKETHENHLASIEKDMAENTMTIGIHERHIPEAEKRRDKFQKKVDKIDHYRRSVFLDIITFSIHWFLRRPARRNKYLLLINAFNSSIDSDHSEITRLTQANVQLSESRVKEENAYEKKVTLFDREEKRINAEEIEERGKIQALNTEVKNTGEWLPLSSIAGLNYQKIIGVYLIHNRKNGRFYVGQSKDVMKRLKQHFDGTTPKNQIFAEDYYSTDKAERESLFEVQILPLSTKDELDRTEKEYIESLGANETGYNKTSGNT
jgi:hypothetical protein